MFEAEVKNGIRLLDEKVPGWAKRINLAKLDMESCHNCILGQLFGLYETGLYAIGAVISNTKENTEEGFFCHKEEDSDKLKEVWRTEIKKRQAAK
jgi:hypothetical protein